MSVLSLSVSLGMVSLTCSSCSSCSACSDLLPCQQASLYRYACDGQAQLKSCLEPHIPTPPSSPLWAPVALGCGLFNGATTPVWEQPRAQDTGLLIPNLLFFHQRSQTTVMGSVTWLGTFLIPPNTSLASIPLAGPDLPVASGLGFLVIHGDTFSVRVWPPI